MNKRLLTTVLIAALAVSALFAFNGQKVFDSTDDVYITAERLCRLTGNLGPTPVFPIPAEEIERSLDRIDYDALSPKLKAMYDRVSAGIEGTLGLSFVRDGYMTDISMRTALEAYGFNNRKSTDHLEFFVPYRDRIPFLTLKLETGMFDHAYLNLEYSYMDDPKSFRVEGGQVLPGQYFYNVTNMGFLFSPAMNGKWDGNFLPKDASLKHRHNQLTYQPVKADASFGTSSFNFYMGRSRQHMGSGITGDMVIGDNFSFQEMMRTTLSTDLFSWYLSITHYDNIENKESFRFEGIHQNRSIQRFDFNFSNKVRFAVNIGAQIASPTMFDWRMIMPMMVVHNWNNNNESEALMPADEINNILGLELEYVPARGLQLGFQFVLDQFRLPVETDSKVPNAFGLLANAKYTNRISSGTFDSSIEFVYTNPYLYLNRKYIGKKDENGEFEKADDVIVKDHPYMYLDHMGGYWYDQSRSGEYGYFGHGFGPDTIALSLATEFTSDHNWSAGAALLYKVQGEYGRLYNLDRTKDYWDWDDANMEYDHDDKLTPTGTPQHALSLTLSAEYTPLEDLRIFGSADVTHYWNYHNDRGVSKTDVQSAIGLSYVIF